MARSTTLKVDRLLLMERVEAKIEEAESEYLDLLKAEADRVKQVNADRAKAVAEMKKAWTRYVRDVEKWIASGFSSPPNAYSSYRRSPGLPDVPSNSLFGTETAREVQNPADRHRRVLSQLSMSTQPTISVSLDNTFGEYL